MDMTDAERWLTRLGVDVFYASSRKVLGCAFLRAWGVVMNIQVTRQKLTLRPLWEELDKEGSTKTLDVSETDFVRFSDFVLRVLAHPLPPQAGTRQKFIHILGATPDGSGYVYRGVKFVFWGRGKDLAMRIVSPSIDYDVVKGDRLATNFYRRCFEHLWEVSHA